ncbi:MAG: acyl carrier protein [Alphaproteobacteria bacterium]|nr:acyl carrier protein [Alphaproteobacteria bacterium]MBF0353764.1 acyl carrier protein [Alphaproteobacteria bacterium]
MTDKLLTIFSEVLRLPAEGLSDDTGPQNTPQWDSLAAMQLVVAIEEAFSTRLSTIEIMKMRSIGVARKVLTDKGCAIQ